MLKIYIGCDHGGFEAKKEVKEILEQLNIYYEDLGAETYNEFDDYPIISKKVCEKVLSAPSANAYGILICGSGTGVAMAANKVKGIRAVQGYDEYVVKMARLDEDANILTLRSRDFDHKKYFELIKTFIDTEFSNEDRHKRRLEELE